mmetsp:Transcript_3289/g.10893  ORF Transcript_3289/g.10893 Transcript_3289/m.10893 type:complete len:102 (-) Transcript_3289:405-710(-)
MAHEQEGDRMVLDDVEDAVIKAEKRLVSRLLKAEKRFEEFLGLGPDKKPVGFEDAAAREYMAHEQEGDRMVLDDVEDAVMKAEKRLEKALRGKKSDSAAGK